MILKFKTNLKCNGCIAAVKPFLDSIIEISSWEVNLDDPNRILEIKTIENPSDKLSQIIINGIKAKDYQIELIN